MKISRTKKVQKTLSFFQNAFKFHEPYQMLVDGTFCHAAVENRFNIQDQIPKYLLAKTEILTTPCIVIETAKLGKKVTGAMLITKKFPIQKCPHEKNPINGSECIKSMIGDANLSRYIVATQDRKLQDELREIPGVPIIYLHGPTPTLEAPSNASKIAAQNLIKGLGITAEQQKTLDTLKEKSGLVESTSVKPIKKRKQKGPNPLSCLKKKNNKNKINNNKIESSSSGKIRKRKRVKTPSHVKEILKSSMQISQ